MTSFVDVVLFLIILAFCSAGACQSGSNIVHSRWRADAIERCEKTQTKEWCEGRAVLEKW